MKKKPRKIWTNKEKFFIAEYTGKYPNKYLAKKFNVSLCSIWQQQRNIKISVNENIVGHDFLTQSEFADMLGLTIFQVNYLKKIKAIESKNLGNVVGIPYTEFERLEEFYKTHLTVKESCKILKLKQNSFLKNINKFNRKKLGASIYINKKQILDYKELQAKSYTVSEFANLVYYTPRNINFMIKNKKIESFKDIFNVTRINKSELTKFRK